MTLSFRTRLWLYALMAMLPVWVNYFKLSTDYSFRGLMIPTLDCLYQAVLVIMAKTSPASGEGPPPIDLKPGDVEVTRVPAAGANLTTQPTPTPGGAPPKPTP